MLTDLRISLEKCLETGLDGASGVMFSGGLDSSLLTALARPYGQLRLYTVGFPGAHDLKAGREGAAELNLTWLQISIDDDMVRRGVCFLRSEMGMDDPLTISFELPLFFICSTVPEKRLLSGQGADELFGGYARYATMPVQEMERAMRQDQESLLSTGRQLEARIAGHFGKEMICPYLSPEVVGIARQFSPDHLIGPLGNKNPLRLLAKELGLSSATAPKKAAQYGSGISKAMKRMAFKEGMELRTWVREVRA